MGDRALIAYLAHPLGFTEPGRVFIRTQLMPALRAAGVEPIDPFSLVPDERIGAVEGMPAGQNRRQAFQQLATEIAETNRRALDAADLVVAVLDGSDVDSGTAAEIGYAFARGKKIVGYRSDLRRGGENEGVCVNLQVEHFVRASGGTVVATLDELVRAVASGTA